MKPRGLDHQSRLARLRRVLAEDNCDALWVTAPADVRWLSGFTGSNGRIFISGDVSALFSDGRYRQQAMRELETAGIAAEVEVHLDPAETGARLSSLSKGLSAVGFDQQHMTVKALAELQEWLPGRTLLATEEIVSGLRRVKDEGERDRLEAAAAIADEALASQLDQIVPGTSERQFQLDLDRAMLDLGADGLSFETIVASGPNSALPHARPSARSFENGDLVVVDFGASVDGYGSDMTRTFCIGDPEPPQQELYDAVAQAQEAGVAMVAAGVQERAVDQACREVLVNAGFGAAFVHGTGHGIGLEIHEQPILSTRAVGTLCAGLIITVEPGAYIAGFGGVRIEDSVVVTDSGCEVITLAPKGLSPHI